MTSKFLEIFSENTDCLVVMLYIVNVFLNSIRLYYTVRQMNSKITSQLFANNQRLGVTQAACRQLFLIKLSK